MSYGKELYNDLCNNVAAHPEKFYSNRIDYKGEQVVVFDYALTIPNDFGMKNALELRGSVFLVDDEGNYQKTLCLPYEKFFNLHEFGYDNDDLVQEGVRRYGVELTTDVIDVLKESYEPVYLDKRDGSIISFFDWKGDVDCKSNSSLTSDYKNEALEIVENDPYLLRAIKRLTDQGFTVITEYTSKHPLRQIVVPYSTTDIIVTGVRNNHDGSYLTFEELNNHFSDKYLVDRMSDVDHLNYEQEDIEGYIVCFEEIGLRIKLKTHWYLERHRVNSYACTPSRVWEMFISKTIDDVYPLIPDSSKEVFNDYMSKCDNLYTSIVALGDQVYNEHNGKDRKEFFETLNTIGQGGDAVTAFALLYTRLLYKFNGVRKDAIEKLNDHLLIKKKISQLGITNL